MKRVAALWLCLLSLPVCAQSEAAKEQGEEPQLHIDKTMGGRLVRECAAVLESPDILLSPVPTFRDKVLLAAGDPKQMTRSQLESLSSDLEIASYRDLGLVLELNYRPPGDRRALLPALLSRWGGLRGSALRDEYYVALDRALEFMKSEAGRKKPEDRGFADRFLLEAGEIGKRSRGDMDDFYAEYRRAELRDAGFTLEMAQGPQQKAPGLKTNLWDKWSALRGERLRDEYYAVLSQTLEAAEKKAGLKNASQRTLVDDLLLEARPSKGLSRNDTDDLFEVYRIANKCDAAPKRPAGRPKQTK